MPIRFRKEKAMATKKGSSKGGRKAGGKKGGRKDERHPSGPKYPPKKK
jgi:hypothetical protein